MQFVGTSAPAGGLAIRKLNERIDAPLTWKLRNMARWGFIKGWIAKHIVAPFANSFGVMTAVAEWTRRKRSWYEDVEREHFLKLMRANRSAEAERYAAERTYWIDYGVVGYRVVTNAGVAYIVDDFDNGSGSADVSLFNFHGVGTGNTAEAAGDTALVTESTTALNPDSTRATGTRSQPAANQFRSTGTLSFDTGPTALVEHGLFTQAATGGGTLLDRTVFATVTIQSGESLQCEYTITFTAGS